MSNHKWLLYGMGKTGILIAEETVRRGHRPLLATPHSYIWAQVDNQKGKVVQAWQETGEGYSFTAAAAMRAVEQVLATSPRGGLTPAQVFGTDFALTVDGVKRYATLQG